MPDPVPFYPRRILLIRLKAVGDVLLATPFLRALRKALPSSQIHFLTYPLCEPIVRNNPHADKIILHPGKKASWGEKARFYAGLNRARYDCVFDLAATTRTAWLALATGARYRVGYAFRGRQWAFTHPVPKNKVRKYQAEVCLDLARFMGLPVDGHQTELFLEPQEMAWGTQTLEELGLGKSGGISRPLVGLNPTGTWPAKRWPSRHWRTLVSQIYERWGRPALLLWGPGDEALAGEIQQDLKSKVVVCPKTDLRQLSALISHLDLLIGNDGAPQHLAQALGVKSLTIFGPTWGISWSKPSDARHRFLQHFLDCGPCDRKVCLFPSEAQQGSHTYQECMDLITPEKVLQAGCQMLGV